MVDGESDSENERDGPSYRDRVLSGECPSVWLGIATVRVDFNTTEQRKAAVVLYTSLGCSHLEHGYYFEGERPRASWHSEFMEDIATAAFDGLRRENARLRVELAERDKPTGDSEHT